MSGAAAGMIVFLFLAVGWDVKRIEYFPWATASALPIWVAITELIKRLS